MKNFDTRTYSISDFQEWEGSKLLILSPSFQRKAVWTTKAKSYLIDTILRGKPMPKVLITQNLVDGKNIRTVVDGQQRLRAILEFLKDGFAVMRTHNQEFAGMRYSDLPESTQSEFWQYEIGVDVLFNTEMSELLDIFSRLNTYSVKLNSTELLNATYLGEFKTAVHELGHAYAEYFLEARILSNAQIARMGEVELAADLLGAILGGISQKTAIKSYYNTYDDDDESVKDAASIFRKTMSFIGDIFDPEDLHSSNFRRVHFFYSMFLSVANIISGRPHIDGILPPPETPSPAEMRVILDDISARYDEYTQKAGTEFTMSVEFRRFIEGSRQATTNLSARMDRSRFISESIIGA